MNSYDSLNFFTIQFFFYFGGKQDLKAFLLLPTQQLWKMVKQALVVLSEANHTQNMHEIGKCK